MYGFNIIIGVNNRKSRDRSIHYKDVIFESNMIDKFQDDKLFFESEKYLVVLDGVILNRRELQGDRSWSEIVLSLYEKDNETFYSDFRGCFAGAIYDKKKERLLIFSDQIGSRFIFYYKDSDSFICSSMMSEMYRILKSSNKKYGLSKDGAICLLTYGYMLGNITLCDKVNKILPGDYLIYDRHEFKLNRYYTLQKNVNSNMSEAEAIELIDKYTRQAVKKVFDKDLEFGYNKHLVPLSAGLETRMLTFISHDLGYTNQLNYTFSQTGYWDETIPKQITADLKHEWLFKALDNGLWLKEVDRVIQLNGGNVIYYGTAHGDSCLRNINMKEFGLCHSGQLGGAFTSSYVTDKTNSKFKLGDGAFSRTYLDKLNVQVREYSDADLGMIYNRGFNGINNGLQYVFNYTEAISPYFDLDYMNACLSIPLKLRENHYIYKKWILQKYPKAASYVWERIQSKITVPTVMVLGHVIPITRILPKILLKLKGEKPTDCKKHMNPIGYYLENNKDLMAFLLSYFKYKDFIQDDSLLDIIENIEKHGTNMEKIQLITLLAAIKQFYI